MRAPANQAAAPRVWLQYGGCGEQNKSIDSDQYATLLTPGESVLWV